MSINRKIKRLLQEYGYFAQLAKQQTGKSYLTQVTEIIRLRKLAGQCGASNYYQFRLYDNDYLHGDGVRDFLGWRLALEFNQALNPRHGVLPAWDKMTFIQIADSMGLPTVPTIACYHPNQKISSIFGRHLRCAKDIKSFLKEEEVYPLFAKPSYSQQGIGCFHLQKLSSDKEKIALASGALITIDELIAAILTTVDVRYHKPECGFLFQQALSMPDELSKFTKWSATSSLRVTSLNDPDGAYPIRAVWKVARKPNHVDNFSKGKYGNLMANVDLTTGEIDTLIDNMHPIARQYSHHPDSKLAVDGFTLCQWQQILSLIKQGGRAFPLMKIHHWDIAMTVSGPQILELNDLGGIEIVQIHGRGLLGEQTRNFVKQHGNRIQYSWIGKL